MAGSGNLTVGPFGGEGGRPWDDGFHTTIRQLILHAGSRINSIQVEYDNGWSGKHGDIDCDCGEEFKIILNYPEEFLISISGHYTGEGDHEVVRSLTIQSNKRQYGPYGLEEGQAFTTSPTSGKIIGFLGKSDTYVNSIGVHFESTHHLMCVGPFGGQGGHNWNDGTYTTIRKIQISRGHYIDSIRIEYDDNGQSKWSDRRGGSGGSYNESVNLDYPNEFLIAVSGYLTNDSSGAYVRSLTFHSNKQKYGPYGTESGKYFTTASNGGKIIGFHGRCGLYLDSIGAYFDSQTFLSIGPFGGKDGVEWDDGTYTTIRQMTLRYGDVVDSIEIEYDKNGESIWSYRHGTSPGGMGTGTVKLDYPNEFLTSISGYYKLYYSHVIICSLTIISNKKQYGPYGAQEGEFFSTSLSGGKIVGVYGRSGSFLDAIGAHFEALSVPIQPISKP